MVNISEQVGLSVCKHFSGRLTFQTFALLTKLTRIVSKTIIIIIIIQPKEKKENAHSVKDILQCCEYICWLSGLAAVNINMEAFGNICTYLWSKVLNGCIHTAEVRGNACCVVCYHSCLCVCRYGDVL